jgi:pimeloyl-ACP methyl ester carboxylesterase
MNQAVHARKRDPGDVRSAIERLVARFDPSVFHIDRRRARLRIEDSEPGRAACDVVIEHHAARVLDAGEAEADAILKADADTWAKVAENVGDGMAAFRAGRLRLRRDLHLGVGFLAATAPNTGRGRLRIARVETAAGSLSTLQAGIGEPAILLHGLGATKASMLPTVGALARAGRRAIAIDLPGFGDSTKPLLASYDARYFAEAVIAFLDALHLERADLIGNSMGGRVAIEVGLRAPDRARALVLLAPSLAWLRSRPWAPYLRLVPTQLGAIQPAPRRLVEQIVRSVIPGAENEWTAAGIDEFLRSYLTPRGRAAFYAAARNIYLEEPNGPTGFWTRLGELRAPSLFVWGSRDPVVPIGFARHVKRTLPRAEHLELPCGHVPQLERPRETHDATLRFLSEPF